MAVYHYVMLTVQKRFGTRLGSLVVVTCLYRLQRCQQRMHLVTVYDEHICSGTYASTS